MFILNYIQLTLIALWTLIFVYVLTVLLPSKVALWLTVHLWAPVCQFIVLSPIKVSGLENLDKNKNYVFMSNHASFYDIPILFWGSKRMLHFLAKSELKDSIFTGFMLKKLEMIFIERGNAQKSVASVRHAEDMIRKGLDIAIFPEGTRTKTGELGVFRKGGFKMAINSGTDIVPVTIKNSAKAWSRSNKKFRPTKVYIHFGTPIPVKDLSEEDAQKIATDTFNIINEELKK